jgi:hypothetical protein
VILGIFAVFLYFGRDKKKRFNWSETYEETSKQPFGTYVVHEMMKTYFPNQKFEDFKQRIDKSINLDSIVKPANYVFIGDGFFTDTADVDKIMAFAHEGNRVLVAANAVPNYFLERVYQDSCDDDNVGYHRYLNEYVRFADLNFHHPQLIENKPFRYNFIIAGDTNDYDWSFIDTLREECTKGPQQLAPIGYINGDNINFAKIKYGNGEIYLHSNPIAFTNYHMLDSNKVRYASKVFSHLQTGAIYWDTKSRVRRDVIRRMNGTNMKFDDNSPLKYVLAQPSLRWAWFIMLGLIGLYMIFMAKRRQRIIPVLEDKSNTSLEFINTIGQMYFREGNYLSVCDMMMKQFQTFVRERYHMAAREMDEDFIKTLAIKSDVPEDRVRTITGYQRLLERNSLTEQSMVEFYHILDNFYKTCK